MKKYNLVNNSLGWLMFAIAAFTYLMTIEPTASFWDCGEFIAQGCKLEVGHPPGNPIFMLAARFFINFASGPETVAVCVNAMSALLSAATILLLFWTITHLVRRLVAKDGQTEYSWQQLAIIMGSGVVGSLAYTWSDTFWYSAVEGEVYAFSSFCTALIFWLILKWENRCDQPHSDRYLVAIAYTVGVAVAVHLLNLLCIPAIVLVVYYRKFKNTNAKGSLLALLASFVIIVLILYGLIPGFVEMAQYFELLFVNTFGFSFNSGVIAYAVLVAALFIWAIYEHYRQAGQQRMKLSFFLSIIASGMLFIGDGILIAAVLTVALGAYLFYWCKKVPVRIFTNVLLGILMIFIGYSSYAVILIRSNAQTPMDQNSPDNVFALSSYLNREQYGKAPLFYGAVYSAPIVYQVNDDNTLEPLKKTGKPLYAKEVKKSPDDPDRYKLYGYDFDYVMAPEMNMLFPRLYESRGNTPHAYSEWLGGIEGTPVEATNYVDKDGNALNKTVVVKPTFLENLEYFIGYQVNYMYWRYFMWNFVGRQNDVQGQGEITHGNWISGIPFIDNPRLGDQSLLPDEIGKDNAGHNVYYMLPLILGIIGLLWQAYKGQRGIEQFWVIFFLFFMTGLAIVLYLNQAPGQPRERDYAFAGSFYAFAIWIGMGVAGLWQLLKFVLNKTVSKETLAGDPERKIGNATVVASVLLGLAIPFQMVSQTWDDHDRSGRYAARDFGMNYLSSVDKNGILFTNGDNDTFPLWYAQEVEGWRTDVRVVNLSYLSTDWYINQMRRPAYESDGLPMQAPKDAYAYDERQFNYFIDPDTAMLVPADKALAEFYSGRYKENAYGYPSFKYPRMFIPVNLDDAVENGIISEEEREIADDRIMLDMLNEGSAKRDGGMTSSKVMSIDILSSAIKEGWKRPVYVAMTVSDEYYPKVWNQYMRSTGMAYEVTPVRSGYDERSGSFAVDTEKAYRNITEKFRWGGLEQSTPEDHPYLDETVRRMVTTTRSTMLDLANALIVEGVQAKVLMTDSVTGEMQESRYVDDRFAKARNVLNLIETKLPAYACPYVIGMGQQMAQAYYLLGQESGSKEDTEKAHKLLENEILNLGQYVRFNQSLAKNPGLYNRLSRIDMLADYYLVQALDLYNQFNEEDKVADIAARLSAMGVDVEQLLKTYMAS